MINYCMFKLEKDGLFCEKIFGLICDWECYCGKYKWVFFKGIICECCGVEVICVKVCCEWMGYIEFVVFVIYIWYFKGVFLWLGYLLDLVLKDLEKIIYFVVYVIILVDEEMCYNEFFMFEVEMVVECKVVEDQCDGELEVWV